MASNSECPPVTLEAWASSPVWYVGMKTESDRTENPEPEDQDPQPARISEIASGLSEDSALALLNSPDVSGEALALLAKNAISSTSRKVAVGLAAHQRTPRHVSIPLLRRIFTFDLMQMALAPAVAPDIKRAAEEQILTRLESLPTGQKITLARRASGRVAAGLLRDSDRRVISAALDNAKLTEPLVVQALMKPNAPETLFVFVSEHSKWSQRREVQIALLRSEKTPLERVFDFGRNFSPEFLREIVPEPRIALLPAPERE
ncbi:MAG: hypothetical protein JWN74_1358 [Acidobacteriaceae bacterium]|nr:hypothetical protein [Acidobacteriaceae bacterium]